MREKIFNLVLILASLTVGLALIELVLRYDGRYADLVAENLVISRAIWDRPANVIQYRKHPDLDMQVEIVFNDFQIRNHDGIDLVHVRAFEGHLIGFFGDSMTENRRVQDEFAFTTILNELLSPGNLVLNFGVDGYGADQSYLKYQEFAKRGKLRHVFYVFSSNDLRNLYETQLFDFSGDQIGVPRERTINPFVTVARKFHTTYLVLDSFMRIKAAIASEVHSSEQLNDAIMNRFEPKAIRHERKRRFRDEYADSIATNLLSDSPTESTKQWAKRFRLLIEAWNREVESNDASFSVVVTPTRISTDLARILFTSGNPVDVIYLIDYFPEGYEKFTFKNDNHWNERGNLRAARAIFDWGQQAGLWPNDDERLAIVSTRIESAIQRIYSK